VKEKTEKEVFEELSQQYSVFLGCEALKEPQ
jgi:hypothetical protein